MYYIIQQHTGLLCLCWIFKSLKKSVFFLQTYWTSFISRLPITQWFCGTCGGSAAESNQSTSCKNSFTSHLIAEDPKRLENVNSTSVSDVIHKDLMNQSSPTNIWCKYKDKNLKYSSRYSTLYLMLDCQALWKSIWTSNPNKTLKLWEKGVLIFLFYFYEASIKI